MFKFIHAADIHLDSPLRGLTRYEEAPVEIIRGACRRAFEGLVELAIEEQVSFVLLAGDLYDGDWKDFSTGIFVSKQIGRLGQHDIQVYAVVGNHDAANKITKALSPPANMTFLDTKKPQTIRLDDPRVAIHGQGFATQHVSQNLAQSYPAAEADRFNIGILHTSLNGREGHAVYAPCTAQDLSSKGYQYWALGHVHQWEQVSADPWIVFPGCVQGRHARETGPKGCALVTVEDGAVSSVVHHELDVLRWECCEVDLEEVEQISEVLDRARQNMLEKHSAAEGRPVALRLRFHGACAVSSELTAYPDRLENQLRALAAEIAGEDLWVEKVQVATSGKLDLDAVLAGDSMLSALLRDVLDRSRGPGGVEGLDAVIAELRQKLPAEAVGPQTGLDLDSADVVARLVGQARQMLVGRLLAEGGKQ